MMTALTACALDRTSGVVELHSRFCDGKAHILGPQCRSRARCCQEHAATHHAVSVVLVERQSYQARQLRQRSRLIMHVVQLQARASVALYCVSIRTLNTKRYLSVSNLASMADKPSGGYNWDKWEGQQKRVSPSAERNKQVILEELQKHLPSSGLVLEVASGTGQHITHFAAGLSKDLLWQPSDVTDEMFGSIQTYVAESGLENVRQPVVLDASVPLQQWPIQEQCAAVLAANLTHISPWPVTSGLVAGAGKLLQPGGILFIYGPFKIDGQFTTDSNKQFHEALVSQNPEWGYRDVEDIAAAAAAAGLSHGQTVSMPANNFVLLFRKDGGS